MTPSGIEPVIFRFVVEHLDHCVIAAPSLKLLQILNVSVLGFKWNSNPNVIGGVITDPTNKMQLSDVYY